MNRYRKKVILFPAGASGHFLASFLTTGQVFVQSQYRMDLGQTISSSIFVPSNLDKIKHTILEDSRQTILTHYNQVSDLRELQDQCWIRKIYPKTNVFGWLKNVFYKKQQIESINVSQAEMLCQFDFMFENMKDSYFALKEDCDFPEDLTIDFGQMKDLDYLKQLYLEANEVDAPDEQIEFAQNYIDLQGKNIEDCNSLDIQDIVKLVNPQDLYDLAILLFVYEKNHNTIDCNRLWTIDDLPIEIDRAVAFLIDNSKKYSIFK